MFLDILLYIYNKFMWRIFKRFVRLITGRCELLRITQRQQGLFSRTRQIESSLCHSRHNELQRCLLLDENHETSAIIDAIVKLKQVKVANYPEFPLRFKQSLDQIIGYRRLIKEVEALRCIAYSAENANHEAQLLQLWSALKPETALESRIGRQWADIGFQGDDPATDFRGMGILGLSNLLFFATRHGDIARRTLQRSYHPQFGYSFAIVGINLTSVACKLLKDGRLKSHFYSLSPEQPRLDDFNFVYVYLFTEFDKFWFDERPVDIMQFNVVKTKFTQDIIHRLEMPALVPFTLTLSDNHSRIDNN